MTGYFERLSAAAFRATEHTGGAWRIDEQHIAPALGLLVHAVERDQHDRRPGELVVGRLSFDILGTIPVDVVEVGVAVLRPGRTIELVEATLSHAGRVAVRLRAWLLQPGRTGDVAGTEFPRLPAPGDMDPFDVASLWPGGFIASVEVRRRPLGPGRGQSWVRTPLPLVAGEPVSPLAAAAGLLDIANGLAVRAQPSEVTFPNLDLTAHLFEQPQAGWLGFDTTVSFGAGGVGVTSSVLHDERGPIGTMAQVLTVRPLTSARMP